MLEINKFTLLCVICVVDERLWSVSEEGETFNNLFYEPNRRERRKDIKMSFIDYLFSLNFFSVLNDQ